MKRGLEKVLAVLGTLLIWLVVGGATYAALGQLPGEGRHSFLEFFGFFMALSTPIGLVAALMLFAAALMRRDQHALFGAGVSFVALTTILAFQPWIQTPDLFNQIWSVAYVLVLMAMGVGGAAFARRAIRQDSQRLSPAM